MCSEVAEVRADVGKLKRDMSGLRRDMSGGSILQESLDDDEDPTEDEETFCVAFPCATMEQFDELEHELTNNSSKRKALVRYYKY